VAAQLPDTFPPEDAVVEVMPDIAVVVTVGKTVLVVKDTSSPYAVPAELVAYARIWYVIHGVSPVILLINDPVPAASLVFESAVIGFVDVLQHTPRAVTDEPPSEVTFPPEVAVVEVISEIAVVVTDARTAPAVNVRSSPYAVPTELIA
jgi:hypothetical protein